MSTENPFASQESFNKVHGEISVQLAEIQKAKTMSYRTTLALFVLNGFSLAIFISNPSTLSAALPVVIAVYNLFSSVRDKRGLNQLEREAKKVRQQLIQRELSGPGGYLVPMKGRDPQEMATKVQAREIAIRNTVRTPRPRDN